MASEFVAMKECFTANEKRLMALAHVTRPYLEAIILAAPRNKTGPSPMQTVDRALRVLNSLAEARREMGVTELARQVGIDPSSTYRILTTLAHHGYVAQDPQTTKYRLGMRLLTLGSVVSESLDLTELSRPVLEHLVELTGETTNLMVREGLEGVYVAGVSGTKTLRRVLCVGTREPLHCSAVGKVILANLPEEIVDQIIDERGLPAMTSRTISEPNMLRRHLIQIKQRGFAIDDEEGEEGLRCIAAPIFEHKGEIAAAVSISGPALRLSLVTLEHLAPTVIQAADNISELLGWQGAGQQENA